MKIKTWLTGWAVTVAVLLSVIGYCTYRIDPYFHYHRPASEKYFYTLNNQRCQNDGISKRFAYNALISGTSMTENFSTTEMDQIFGCHSVKVAYSGGSYKEINDNIASALRANPELKTVLRCLDMNRFDAPWDLMRTDLGAFPTYLYDNNPLNDVKYLFNRDVFFGRACRMMLDQNRQGFQPGITSFDVYSRWQDEYTFGMNSILPEGVSLNKPHTFAGLSEEEKEVIQKNIERNVTDIPDQYPDVDFYYYYSPYSVMEWCNLYRQGTIFKMLEMERFVTELIIPHQNIHLFSFNNRTDITADLNNYKDSTHYGCWINSLILKWIHEGKYELTKENYQQYCQQEYDFYTNFDYESLNGQADYEADFYAAALLNKELTGAEPVDVLHSKRVEVALRHAKYLKKNKKILAIDFYSAPDQPSSETGNDFADDAFAGVAIKVNADEGYQYLTFNGQRMQKNVSLCAFVCSQDGKVLSRTELTDFETDSQWHQYVVDLSAGGGNVSVQLGCAYDDSHHNGDSFYRIKDIVLY